MPPDFRRHLIAKYAALPRRRRRGAPALALLEMILLLAVMGLMLGATIWAMRMSFDVHRRVADESVRQRVMHSILRQLRTDLAASNPTRLILEVDADDDAESDDSGADEHPEARRLCTLTIKSPRSEVKYDLLATPQPMPGNPALRRARPSGQSLVRTDESGRPMTWSLYGQHLVLRTRPAARGTLLDVEFLSRIRFETGDETAHRFVTTLLAEGVP